MKKIIIFLTISLLFITLLCWYRYNQNYIIKKQIKNFLTEAIEAKDKYLFDYNDYISDTKIGTFADNDVFLMKGKYENYNDIAKPFEKYYSKDLIPFVIAYNGIINVNGKSAYACIGVDLSPLEKIGNISIKDSMITAEVIFSDEWDKYTEKYILKKMNGKWVIISINGDTKLEKINIEPIKNRK